MVLNVVLHRYNLDRVERIIEMALKMGEIFGIGKCPLLWLELVNRAQLLPTRAPLIHAETVVNAWRAKVGNKICILCVVPDYFEARPKACMHGWGAVFLAAAAARLWR